MATVQKTTVRRFNGVDWDSIYFASAADVTVLGTAARVKEDPGFEYGDILEFNDTIADLLIKTINYVTTLDVKRIAALENGEGLTKVDASKIEGIIDRENLPEDIGGKTVKVPTEEAKDALTADDVNTGDIVKIENGKTYIVADTNPDGSVEYIDLVDNESAVDWKRISNTPTTLKGYGITDAATSEAFDELYEDVHTNFDASWIQNGVLPLKVIPKTAVSEIKTVASYEAMADLTAEDVQLGDTVKIADKYDEEGNLVEPGKMYYVVDETKFGTEDWESAVVPYTAAAASQVYWSGVLDTPTTLKGYGITDAATADEFKTLDDAHTQTRKDLDDLITAIMGEPVAPPEPEVVPGPSNDPDDPLYTGDIEAAADNDEVTWAGLSWIIVDKKETEATMMVKSYPDAGTGTEADIATLQAAFDAAALSAGALKLVKDNKTFAASSAQLGEWAVDTSQMDYDGNAWWLTDALVETSGMIDETYGPDDVAAYRAFAVVDLTHPDDTIKIPPSQDPENPAYTEDLKNAADGDVVTWGKYNWTVVDMTDTTATLMYNSGYDSNIELNNAGAVNGHEVFDDELPAGVKALLKDGHTFSATVAQVQEWAITPEQLVFDGNEWWLLDAKVDAAGAINTDDLTGRAMYRPFVTVDLTNPDAPKAEQPKTLIDRVDDIEKIIGDKTTEGTILNEIEKLKQGESLTAVPWDIITDTPTTLAGYGITDAVSVDDVIDDAIVSETNTLENVAGKIVKVGADGKLHADIAGDAQTLEGHDSAYFATKEEFDELSLSVPVYLNSVDEFVDPKAGQMVMIPLADPVEIGPDGNPVVPLPDLNDTTMEAVTGTLFNKDLSTIQNIAFDGKKVTGTSEYISWPEFSSVPEDQVGNFIVLKFNPDPADATIKVKSKDGDAAGYKTLDADNILIWKLTASKNIEILVNDEPHTIDVSGVTMKPAPATAAAAPVSETLLGMDTSTIQNLTINGNTVTGTSEYITWPEFSSVEEDQKGNFIVLKIDPTPADAVIKVKTKDGDAEGYKTLDDDHILVWKLTAGKNIELKINDDVVVIDVSGVEMKEAPAEPVEP